jgi:hypothetical protein
MPKHYRYDVYAVAASKQSSWTNKTNQFILSLTIPTGSTTRVNLPIIIRQSIYENGNAVSSVIGVTEMGSSDGRVIYDVVSGAYVFTVE